MNGTKYVEAGSSTDNRDCSKHRGKPSFTACSWQFKEQMESGKGIDTEQESPSTWEGIGRVFLLLGSAAVSF